MRHRAGTNSRSKKEIISCWQIMYMYCLNKEMFPITLGLLPIELSLVRLQNSLPLAYEDLSLFPNSFLSSYMRRAMSGAALESLRDWPLYEAEGLGMLSKRCFSSSGSSNQRILIRVQVGPWRNRNSCHICCVCREVNADGRPCYIPLASLKRYPCIMDWFMELLLTSAAVVVRVCSVGNAQLAETKRSQLRHHHRRW